MTSARRCADVWFVVRFAPRVSRLCAGLSALDVTIRGGLFYLLSKQAGRRADLDELEAGFGLPRVRDAHHTLGFFILNSRCILSATWLDRPPGEFRQKSKKYQLGTICTHFRRDYSAFLSRVVI